MKRVKNLIFSPHPDDELLGCLSFLTEPETVVVYVTSGGTPWKIGVKTASSSVRAAEATLLSKELNFFPIFLSLPDGGLLSNYCLVENKILGLVEMFQPQTVLVPWSGETHPDHLVVHLTGQELSDNVKTIKVLGFEVWTFIPAHESYVGHTRLVNLSWKKKLFREFYKSQIEVLDLMNTKLEKRGGTEVFEIL